MCAQSRVSSAPLAVWILARIRRSQYASSRPTRLRTASSSSCCPVVNVSASTAASRRLNGFRSSARSSGLAFSSRDASASGAATAASISSSVKSPTSRWRTPGSRGSSVDSSADSGVPANAACRAWLVARVERPRRGGTTCHREPRRPRTTSARNWRSSGPRSASTPPINNSAGGPVHPRSTATRGPSKGTLFALATSLARSATTGWSAARAAAKPLRDRRLPGARVAHDQHVPVARA